MSGADETLHKLATWTFQNFNVSGALGPATVDSITNILYREDKVTHTFTYNFTAVISYPTSASAIKVA